MLSRTVLADILRTAALLGGLTAALVGLDRLLLALGVL